MHAASVSSSSSSCKHENEAKKEGSLEHIDDRHRKEDLVAILEAIRKHVQKLKKEGSWLSRDDKGCLTSCERHAEQRSSSLMERIILHPSGMEKLSQQLNLDRSFVEEQSNIICQ